MGAGAVGEAGDTAQSLAGAARGTDIALVTTPRLCMEETAATEVPQTQYTVIRTAARVRFYPLFLKKLKKRGPLSGGTCKWTVMIC